MQILEASENNITLVILITNNRISIWQTIVENYFRAY